MSEHLLIQLGLLHLQLDALRLQIAMNTLPAKPPTKAQLKRDGRVRRAVREIRKVAPALNDVKYTPLLRSYATLTILIEKAALRLRDMDPISPETNELRQSYSTLAGMIRTQATVAEKLALTPGAAVTLAKPVAVLDLEAYRADSDENPE